MGCDAELLYLPRAEGLGNKSLRVQLVCICCLDAGDN